MIKNMTEKQQHAWKTAAEHASENPLVTIGEVAKDAGCSPASITLLARRVGFAGWPELRRYLAHQSEPPAAPDSLGGSMVLPEVQKLLLDNKDKSIFVYGAGDGAFAANYLVSALLSHGFYCLAYTRQALIAQARRSSAGMLFLVNESGIALADDACIARDFGYCICSITGNPSSPVARLATIPVILRSNKSKPQSYEPDFFCARAMTFTAYLEAGLPYLFNDSIADHVALSDIRRMEDAG